MTIGVMEMRDDDFFLKYISFSSSHKKIENTERLYFRGAMSNTIPHKYIDIYMYPKNLDNTEYYQ